MDPSRYLNVKPAKLTVAQLRAAIVELGSQPSERQTKAQLIAQFQEALEAYQRAQGRASTRLRDVPAEASPNITDFFQGPPAPVNVGFSLGPQAARARDDLTQSAFDFTGVFGRVNNGAIQAQVAADRSRYHDHVTPMRQLKSRADIERTPGERRLPASQARGDSLRLTAAAAADQSEHEISAAQPQRAQRGPGLQASVDSTAGTSERDPDLSRAYLDCDTTMTKIADIFRRGGDSVSDSLTVSQGPGAPRPAAGGDPRRASRRPGSGIAGSGYTGPRPREPSQSRESRHDSRHDSHRRDSDEARRETQTVDTEFFFPPPGSAIPPLATEEQRRASCSFKGLSVASPSAQAGRGRSQSPEKRQAQAGKGAKAGAPAPGSLSRPAARPGVGSTVSPGARRASKPVAQPVAKPAARPVAKADAGAATRPAVRPAAGPAARQSAGPEPVQFKRPREEGPRPVDSRRASELRRVSGIHGSIGLGASGPGESARPQRPASSAPAAPSPRTAQATRPAEPGQETRSSRAVQPSAHPAAPSRPAPALANPPAQPRAAAGEQRPRHAVSPVPPGEAGMQKPARYDYGHAAARAPGTFRSPDAVGPAGPARPAASPASAAPAASAAYAAPAARRASQESQRTSGRKRDQPSQLRRSSGSWGPQGSVSPGTRQGASAQPERRFTYHAASLVDRDDEIQRVPAGGEGRGVRKALRVLRARWGRLRLGAAALLALGGAALLIVLALAACITNAVRGRIVFTVPGVSNLFAFLLGGLLSGPQPAASRSYVFAPPGAEVPCPLHGLCEDGALVGCEAGYSLFPVRVDSLGRDLPARWGVATRTFGNRLYYLYYPFSFAGKAQAWRAAGEGGGPAAPSQLGDGAFEVYLERPRALRRSVCLSEVEDLRRLDGLLGRVNRELLEAKGRLLCSSGRNRNIKRALEYTPLYRVRAFQDYLRRGGLYLQAEAPAARAHRPAARLPQAQRKSYRDAVSASLREDLLREEILAELAEKGVVVSADEVDALVRARVVTGSDGAGVDLLPAEGEGQADPEPEDPYAGIPRELLFREDATLTLLRNGLAGRDPEVVSVIPPALAFRERLLNGEGGNGTAPPALAEAGPRTPEQAFLALLASGEVSSLAAIEVRSTGEPVFSDLCLLRQWVAMNPTRFLRIAALLGVTVAGVGYLIRKVLRGALRAQLVACSKAYLEEYREECTRRAGARGAGAEPYDVYLGAIRSEVLCNEVIDQLVASPGLVAALYRRRLAGRDFAARRWGEACALLVQDQRVDRFFTSEGAGQEVEYFMWSPDQRRRSSGLFGASWGTRRRESGEAAAKPGEGRRGSKIRFSDRAYQSMDAAPRELMDDERSPSIED